MKYSIEKVMIPTYQALIGCPRCDSRNTRTFPDVQFMDDDKLINWACLYGFAVVQ